jgi:hypothetical protein
MKSEEESDGMEVDEKDETDSEKESERSEQVRQIMAAPFSFF